MEKADMGKIIKKKLHTFQKMGCETELTAIRKTGSTAYLSIADMGEGYEEEKFVVKVLPVIIGSESGAMGEVLHGMELGNNDEKYMEFIEIEQGETTLQTGDAVVYQQEEYILYEILPVVMGDTLLCRQYKAKKVL